ncbi:TRAP transporter small permease [Pseudonocardia zijingensis]|jgi:TRAP-type C4-dicarboxylate transport system permease small subunit|uniref:TRAP transporter small permease n=1 Tax=Pseudonocardia zijingensis TaxID=153376 RepID=A0ABP3YMA1_9PSEU
MTTVTEFLARNGLVSQEERHLKARALDAVELLLLCVCGLLLFTFTLTVMLDVLTRTLGAPWLWLQEATLVAFVWGLFLGAAVALRRNEHIYLTSVAKSLAGFPRIAIETFNSVVMIAITVTVAVVGFRVALQGFGNFLPVTGLPLAYITGAVPAFAVLSAVFAVERLVKGWRTGFEGATHDPREQALRAADLEGPVP